MHVCGHACMCVCVYMHVQRACKHVCMPCVFKKNAPINIYTRVHYNELFVYMQLQLYAGAYTKQQFFVHPQGRVLALDLSLVTKTESIAGSFTKR